MAEEQEPFLEKIEDTKSRTSTIRQTWNWLAKHHHLVVAHVMLLVAYALGCLVIVRSQNCVERVYHCLSDTSNATEVEG